MSLAKYNKSILSTVRTILTFFLILLIPIYWQYYGPQNFFWFSDIGLLLTVIALWVESPLIISMLVVGFLPFEIMWVFDFILQLLLNHKWLGFVDYMFNPNVAIFLRSLSFFHLLLPLVWIWYLLEWGYDKRAIWYQTVLLWVMLLLTYFFTDPEKNINWVFHPLKHQWEGVSSYLWLFIMMVGIPLLIYFPAHYFFKFVVKKRGS